MARKADIDDGRTSAYYLGERHRVGLKAFARTHGHGTGSAAMRAILDTVADSEDIPRGKSHEPQEAAP